MNLATTMLFYLTAGAAVAVAILLRHDASAPGHRAFQAATAVVFWPLYLPLLLHPRPHGRRETAANTLPVNQAPTAAHQELERTIAQVEAELDGAVNTLDGWSDSVLAREQNRFVELRAAWRQQATRIAELDRLLAEPAFLADTSPAEPSQRAAVSEAARRENITRLQSIRARLHDDLMGNLARVRELVTMIHLARYTGAPAARAEELVEQIAAAVAGLTEVAGWQQVDVEGTAA